MSCACRPRVLRSQLVAARARALALERPASLLWSASWLRPSLLPACPCRSVLASFSRWESTRASASPSRCFSLVISSNVAILTYKTEHSLTGIDQSLSACITAMHTMQQ
jgi:hypothetical protein